MDTKTTENKFFSYAWHIDPTQKSYTIIRIYGLNEKNENVCVIVNNFTPYVYIDLSTGSEISWDDDKASMVLHKIEELLKDQKPILGKLMMKKRLYYAHIDKNGKRKLFPFLFCSFSHTDDIKALNYKLLRPLYVPGLGNISLKVHEHNASPVLQLTSLRNMNPTGWIKFKGKKITKEDDRVTSCHHEYVVNWKNLSEDKSDIIAKPLLLAFDIEVNSSIPSAMPDAERPDDKIFQCSCIFGRQGAKQESYEVYLLSLGEPDISLLDENTNLLIFNTEHDLLLGFTNLINEKQPNVIMGYNIFNFDIPYMAKRAEYNFCVHEFDQLGFLKDAHAEMKEITWSSSAFKNQSFHYLDAEGRIFVDMLPVIRRDYNLPSYALKYVATVFLRNIEKDPLGPKDIFKCYRLGMQNTDKGKKALAICGKYCVKDSFVVIKLYETLTTWIGTCELSKVCNTLIFSIYSQGQQVRTFSQTYKKCTHENTVVENNAYICKESDRYMGAIVFDPTPGVYKNIVSFDFNSLYPTSIISSNICWSTLVTDDNIPDSMCHVMEWEEHNGCSHDPKMIRMTVLNDEIKLKEAEVKELRRQRDLKSNKDRIEEFKIEIEASLKNIKPLREERVQLKKGKPKVIVCCKRKFRWLKSPMGVMPEILTYLLEARAATKNLMKPIKAKLKDTPDGPEKDELQTYYDVLDKRQTAMKLSANSVSQETPIPCKIKGDFCYRTIKNLSMGDWACDNDGNELSTPIPNLEVWSDIGFTPVKYVFRHLLPGIRFVQIFTTNGFVTCTEDHSLLLPDGKEVKPCELKVGDELLHVPVNMYNDIPEKINKKLTRGIHYVSSINVTQRIPDYIFNSSYDDRYNYFTSVANCHDTIVCKYDISAASWLCLIKSLGYSASMLYIPHKKVFVIKVNSVVVNKNKIIYINYPLLGSERKRYLDTCCKAYVYDIETASHHFAAGVGDLIVHNSAYGGMGVRKGYLPFMPGAMCTTYVGRKAIEKAAKSVVEDHKGVLIYGDSVASYTPVLIMQNNKIFYRTIDNLPTTSSWIYEKDRNKYTNFPNNLFVWSDHGFTKIRRIIKHITCKKLYRVYTHSGIITITQDHSLLTPDGKEISPTQVKIGDELLHKDLPPSFILSYAEPGSDLDMAQKFHLSFTKPGNNNDNNNLNKIIKIIQLPNSINTVYDLETDNHHFSAGVGRLVVHNTDSNYVAFPHLSRSQDVWDHAVNVAQEVSKLYPKPMKLAFEDKIYHKILFLTKKRYMYLVCDRDGKVNPKIDKKGVLLQRRDNCAFIRKVYEAVVMMIFDGKSCDDILYFILCEINKLCSASYPASDFAITKSVGDIGDLVPYQGKDKDGKDCWKVGDYKVAPLPQDEKTREKKLKLKEAESEEEYYLRCLPAQAQLAEKMRKRGQLVPAGARIGYVITTTGGHTAKQYIKLENAEYFARHSSSLEIDYLTYLKQLANPMDQLLEIMYIGKDGKALYKGFHKNFVLEQYKYRYQVRGRLLNQVRSFTAPKLIFEGETEVGRKKKKGKVEKAKIEVVE